MDFMKSMEEFKGLEYFKENNKFRNDVGDKYFDVKFYINDLMSVIVLILLNLNDIEQDSFLKDKLKLIYEESGNEKILYGFLNDYKMSDFFRDEVVLEVLIDYVVKISSSDKFF